MEKLDIEHLKALETLDCTHTGFAAQCHVPQYCISADKNRNLLPMSAVGTLP